MGGERKNVETHIHIRTLHKRLGIPLRLSLSVSLPFVAPTANLVQEHKWHELDVGTFCPI
jgi:hypothetical protein